MKWTPKQKQQLSRVTNKIDSIRNGNKLEYTPLDISNLNRCYKELLEAKTTKTILPAVVEVFADCGFTVDRRGMEWIIAL